MTPHEAMKNRVVLIGSGNVATSLAHALQDKCRLVQIYSRHLDIACRLAAAVHCDSAVSDLAQLTDDADTYIIAVHDDAIADVVAATADNGALWVHTSGSKPMQLFEGHRQCYGVLYPMQSFSRQLVTPLDDVHLFVEGNSAETLARVENFAHLLSKHVVAASSEQRRQLHVAAVFSCNFANHLWTLASEVLADAHLPFDAMMPLIRTTVAKLDHLSPAASQTGPAVRHDQRVIDAHLAMLQGDKRDIYDLMTRSIMERNPMNDHAEQS